MVIYLHEEKLVTKKEIKKIIDPLYEKLLAGKKEEVIAAVNQLFNLFETMMNDMTDYQDEIQRLKDTLDKLMGEQGKPTFKKSKKDQDDEKEDHETDHSSEKERHARKPKKPRQRKKKRKSKLTIHREEYCQIDLSTLPDDVIFKGYKHHIIQDIKIVPDNIEFKRAAYYSPSLKRTFIADLPSGYHGDYGPGVRALTLTLYHQGDMTQPGISRFYQTFNIEISPTTISRLLTDNHQPFHQEKADIVVAGRQATNYQGIDDTQARVNGQSYHTFVLCNPFYAAYFTLPNKDRLTVLQLLCNNNLSYQFTEQTYQLLEQLGLPKKSLQKLYDEKIEENSLLTLEDCQKLFSKIFPGPRKYRTYKRYVLEASAITYYRNSEYAIEIMMSDDAPQFQLLAAHNALCWIHALRHYKKLKPLLKHYQQYVEDFLDKAWDFYQKLLDYKEKPNTKVAEQLKKEFDQLFSNQTGYDLLDQRIDNTRSKKEALLLVLTYSFLPLHNNDSELAVRKQARYRDIHLQNKNAKGVSAKDTFMTITQTSRKLAVNVYDYIHDRLTKKYDMPSLASVIMQNSQITHDSS